MDYISIPYCILLLVTMATFTMSSTWQTYITHMDASKVKNVANSFHETRQFYESIIKSSTPDLEITAPQLLYVYQTAMSGFAAKLSFEQYEFLKKLDGVLSVTPDELLSLDTTHSPRFLNLLEGKGLWARANVDVASDVIVGIIDTGIWPEHASFHDSDMSPVPSKWKGSCQKGRQFSHSNCNKKLIGARFFYKGYQSSTGKINRTSEFLSPRDSHGHGTHTASTVAGNRINGASMFGFANGTASGISPVSRIAAYKACWSQGCASSDLTAAIDQAVADGVDVLSLSLGGFPKPYYGDSIAIASFGAIQKGVFVSCSAGNLGPITSSVSNTAPWIMTVGAGSLDRHFPTYVRLGDGRKLTGSSLFPAGKGTDKLPLVYKKSAGKVGAEFCTMGTLDRRVVKGKIVVCENGMIGRTEKGAQVKMAGGAGMLLLNHENAGEELLADAHVLPAASLGASAAKVVRSYLNSSNPRASISSTGTVYGDPAPRLSAFSSRGPNAVDSDIIKPDVIAPGLNILAAWPPTTSPSMLVSDKRRVKFNILSGTSMSCPHVSGVAALLKSVHPHWSPAAIKSALMTTAYTEDNHKSPISDASSSVSPNDATPFGFGSGHVDPDRASDPGLVYDIFTKDYLLHLCSLNYNSSQMSLFSGGNFTCPPFGKSQFNLNYPSFSVNFVSPNTVLIHRRTVTNVGKPSSTYKVQVNAPKGVRVNVQPKTLSFKKLGQELSYKVKFTAVKDGLGATSSFGSIVWVTSHYSVRSSIAAAWL